ncbi:MAG TPA: YeeE/YedE thiosulfate transporter family protein [Syntrophales bacterium]|nr:YeeE/YedE thiosulfate transporter family protein [Syntrophales bacterium]HPQ43374.1 YeeE/YedE thiosulfate transporter family protein [Syntrophales bacterium]
MKRDEGSWSPYLAGALSGLVLVLSVFATNKFFGSSTTFARTAGAIEKLFAPERTAEMAYFVKYVPKVDWQMMFVIGIFLGALIASITSGDFRLKAVPDMWERRFGSNTLNRGIIAFCGGIIVMFGARLAGGCPTGHGLSGSLQLAVSGYIALISFFIGGIVIARMLYGGGRRP